MTDHDHIAGEPNDSGGEVVLSADALRAIADLGDNHPATDNPEAETPPESTGDNKADENGLTPQQRVEGNHHLRSSAKAKAVIALTSIGLATATAILHDNPYAENMKDLVVENPTPSLIVTAVCAGAVAIRAAFKHNRQEDLFEAQHDGVPLRERVANHLPSWKTIKRGTIILAVSGISIWAGLGIKGAHDRRLAERNADPSEYEHHYGEPYDVLTSTIGCDEVGETEVRPGEDSLWEIAIETLYLNGMPITNENIAAVNNHMAQGFDKDPKRMQVGDNHNTYYCETPDEGAITTEESQEQHFNRTNRHLEKEYGVRIVLPVNPSS